MGSFFDGAIRPSAYRPGAAVARVAAMLDYVAGVVTSIIAAVVISIAVYIWRRLWNPVVWRFDRSDESHWTITRMLNPVARALQFVDPYGHGASLEPNRGPAPQPIYHGPETIDLARGEHVGASKKAYVVSLFWIERGRWRGAEFNHTDLTTAIVVRRRDVMSVEQWRTKMEQER